MSDIKEELRELKLDLNAARRRNDRKAVYEIQDRIDGLSEVKYTAEEATEKLGRKRGI